MRIVITRLEELDTLVYVLIIPAADVIAVPFERHVEHPIRARLKRVTVLLP